MIPQFITELFTQLTPETVRRAAGFRLQMAFRKKLQERNSTLPFASPRRLTSMDIEALVLAPSLAPGSDATDDELAFLAQSLTQAYDAYVDAYSAEGFENPVRAALENMKRFSLNY